MRKHFEHPLLLHGQVVLTDGKASKQHLLVENGLVTSVSKERPQIPEAAVEVQLQDNDWIFPGLLDLHSHTDYNILPIWSSPIAPFDNRHVWRKDSGYERLVKNVKNEFEKLDKRHVMTLEVFGELQAVAGGTTVLQEGRPLDNDEAGEGTLLLCRDTADPSDLGLTKGQRIHSPVDFLRPDRDTGAPSDAWGVEVYERERKANKLAAVLAHLAEGRSGFGWGLGCDAYSRSEFEAFMAHPSMEDAGAVSAVPFSIIHGSGIDPRDADHVQFLLERNISVIWSPFSNLLLYGDTLDVEAFLDAGINLALGSDWSPSGSKHVWDEAKFARFYLEAIGAPVSDAQIFQMVTTNAARCLGTNQLGRIEVGGPADFFVLRSLIPSDSAMEVFLATTDRDVRAVVVAGRPIYGEAELLESFGVPAQPMPQVEGTAASGKAVHLPPGVDVNLATDLQEVENFLKLNYGILRSNTLASSDVHYGQRLAELKAYTVRFGWSAIRWKHERWKEEQRKQQTGASAG